MRIIVATDKFKGTLSAPEACEIISESLRKRYADAEIVSCPMADGGEGTAAVIAAMCNMSRCEIHCQNAKFEDITAEYFISGDSKNAIIDSSAVIGLQKMLSEPEPMRSSSFPLGKVVKEILQKAENVTVCIGGTATVDCGIGFLQGLGCEIYSGNSPLTCPVTPENIRKITKMAVPESLLNSCTFVGEQQKNCTTAINETSEKIKKCRLFFLSDVDVPLISDDDYNMLLFAPQKGVRSSEMAVIEENIRHLTSVQWNTTPNFECRYGGAAGGLGFALNGVLKASGILGAEAVIEKYRFFNPTPDLIITGEGRFDRQSTRGKVVGRIMEEAARLGVKVIVMAGCVEAGCEADFVINTSEFFPKYRLNSDTAAKRLSEATKSLYKQVIK